MKIAIIGYSGSGKSTLAKKLSEKYRCPLLYLDTVNFENNWRQRERIAAKKIVYSFMENDSWVIDGNYHAFYHERRMEEADKIIFMNFPRSICIRQAFARYLKYRNKSRESMSEGCNEKFDFEFIMWILFKGRSKKYKERYKKVCTKYKDKLVMCKSRKDVENKVLNIV